MERTEINFTPFVRIALSGLRVLLLLFGVGMFLVMVFIFVPLYYLLDQDIPAFAAIAIILLLLFTILIFLLGLVVIVALTGYYIYNYYIRGIRLVIDDRGITCLDPELGFKPVCFLWEDIESVTAKGARRKSIALTLRDPMGFRARFPALVRYNLKRLSFFWGGQFLISLFGLDMDSEQIIALVQRELEIHKGIV